MSEIGWSVIGIRLAKRVTDFNLHIVDAVDRKINSPIEACFNDPIVSMS